jgi:hypothetical protein
VSFYHRTGGELLRHSVEVSLYFCARDAYEACRYAAEQLFIAEVGFDINNFRLPLRNMD